MSKKKLTNGNEEGRSSDRSSQRSLRFWLKKNHDLIKAYVIFILFSAAAFFVLMSPWGDRQILEPLNRITAVASGWLIALHDDSVQIISTRILSSSGGVDIREGCNSVYATIIFLSGVFAFPTGWGKKLLGALLGSLALFAINLVRVVTLYYLSQHDRNLFDEAHLYIWQFAIILIGGLLWLLWYDKIVRRHSAKTSL